MKRRNEDKLSNYFSKMEKTGNSDSSSNENESTPIGEQESDYDSDIPLDISSFLSIVQNDSERAVTGLSLLVRENENEPGNVDCTNKDYPSVWTEEQWLHRKTKHKWLTAKNGRLGCNDCYSACYLGPQKHQGLSLSNVWVNCQVSFNGTDKTQQLKSLRTKISAHQASLAHNTAIKILAESKKSKLENFTLQQQEVNLVKNTERIFNTVYYLVKKDRPFTDHEDLINLQKNNGLDMVETILLHSRYSATQITNHISSEFRKKLISKLIAENRKLSVLIDESITLGKETVLIVYIKTFINCKEEIIFLDLIALSNQKSAETIVSELLNCLYSYGLTDVFLQKNLISLACDGANVTIAKYPGVGKLLKDKLQQPNIIIWHCLTYRLELAVHDSIAADVNAVNHFESFVDVLYNLFSQSSKNRYELKRTAASLCLQLNKIGRVVLELRWVSSSFTSVSAVWDAYLPLLTYFKEEATVTSSQRSANERQKYTELYLRMESIEFLKDLALMYDVLKELASLSLQLQERNIIISRADKLIRRTVRIIETFKDEPGVKEREANKAEESMTYLGIALTNNKRIVSINRLQFISNVITNLNARCFTTVSSRQDETGDNEIEAYKQLLADFEILNPDTWPEDGENDFMYGDESIINMCSMFRLNNVRSISNGFREYFDEGGKRIPNSLAPLSEAIRLIPCSTAECERGFSTMNSIINKLRTDLVISNVSSLMFIKLNGPPISTWNAVPYVKSWLQLYHRSAEDAMSPTVSQHGREEREVWKLF